MGQLLTFPNGRRFDLADADAALAAALQPPKTRVLELYLIDDAKHFARRFGATPTVQCEWEYIADAFASQCDCDPEEIDIQETDDGDRVTARGVIVGRIARRTL